MEVWKEIEGFNGDYLVSNYGRVKSFKMKHERIMRLRKDKDGYMLITLHNNNHVTTKKVHRLVAQAFIPNPENLPQVNHKDENKANNIVDNLEWCTCKYNINYGAHTQKVANTQRGRKHTCEHIQKIRENAINKRKVKMLSLDGKVIKRFKSASDAGRYVNGNTTNVIAVIKGRSQTYKGYLFAYDE